MEEDINFVGIPSKVQDMKPTNIYILPVEILTIILSYTCLYISSQVCSSWKQICLSQPTFARKLYIISRKLYNYYRNNKYLDMNEIISDAMIINSEESRKLLYFIVKIDKRNMDDIYCIKFFEQAIKCEIIDWIKEKLHWDLGTYDRIIEIAGYNISLEMLKYLDKKYHIECLYFTFNKNNTKSIEYLENKGFKKRIENNRVLISWNN